MRKPEHQSLISISALATKRHSWIGTRASLTKEPDRSKLPRRSKLPHFTVTKMLSCLGIELTTSIDGILLKLTFQWVKDKGSIYKQNTLYNLVYISKFSKFVILKFSNSPTQILMVFLSRKTVCRATHEQNIFQSNG